MSQPKPKEKHQPAGMNRWLFMGFWTLFSALGWGVFITIYLLFDLLMADSPLWWLFLLGIVPALLLAPVQQYLFRQRLGHSIGGWLPLSLVGWLIGAFSFWLLDRTLPPIYLILAWFMPVFLLQTWSLRRVGSSAWLWLLAGLASTIVFLRSGVETADGLLTWAFAGGLQGVITALVFLWIHDHRRETTDLQHAADTSRLEDRQFDDAQPDSSTERIAQRHRTR